MGSIQTLYLNWLKNMVFAYKECEYSRLMELLYSIPFYSVIEMDANRAEDGIALRYRFGYENDISRDEINDEFVQPCSVLEVMIALCVRCAERIIDEDVPDCINSLFCEMLTSLGVSGHTDEMIDIREVQSIVKDFLDRDYCRNGKGGLFTVNCTEDLRTMEIWYQMCMYINENYKY